MRELVENRHERSMYRQAAGSLTELSYPKIRSVKSCGFLYLTYLLRYVLQVAVAKYDIYHDIWG